jgi:capsular polysaccharide transport system permease protein
MAMSHVALPSRRLPPATVSPFRGAMTRQVQVLWALILHDIKSRFFGNGLGYVVTILWPSVHIAIIVLAFVLGHRPVPYGSSALLYAATGVMPYIAWNYISRFVCLGLIMNRSFMAYPIIKPLDMMIARLALELVSTFIISVGLVSVLALCQAPFVPLNMAASAEGLLSAVFLGIGFGIFNGVITLVFPLWNIGYVIVIILFWFTSGMVVNPESLPEPLGYYISFNPLMHCVEWVRSGYYADFPAHLLDKSYVLWCGAGSLALGLVGERIVRRYLRV